MPCFPTFYASFSSRLTLGLHAHMLDITFLAVPCLDLHVYMHVSMPICLDLCFHMFVCLDLCSLHALYYLPCVFALHTMFICLGLDLVCHGMCYCSPFVPFIAFSCVLARSRPYGLCHRPCTMAHIKTVWIIPICMSMLAYFYALCLC